MSALALVEAVSKPGCEADVKPGCSALTQAGKPCRRHPVREDGLCDVHGGRIDVREAGRRGGQAKPKTDREQANVLAGFELDADGVPVDLERWEDWRLYELSAQDKNQAAAIAALKERLARRQTDARPCPSMTRASS